MADLRKFLSLAMPNQYCNIKLILGDKKSLTFMIPIHSTTVLYDKCVVFSFSQGKKLASKHVLRRISIAWYYSRLATLGNTKRSIYT